MGEGGEFGGCGHPAHEVRFEGEHVYGAFCEDGFAGSFVANAVGEEEGDGGVEESVYSCFPYCAAVGLRA